MVSDKIQINYKTSATVITSISEIIFPEKLIQYINEKKQVIHNVQINEIESVMQRLVDDIIEYIKKEQFEENSVKDDLSYKTFRNIKIWQSIV